MPEPVSTAVAGYAMALYLSARTSAVSREARTVGDSASAFVASTERSVALFGAKSHLLNRIYEVAAECSCASWDGEEGAAISPAVVNRAIHFIRVLPEDMTLPEVGPEPDGSISFDWIVGRARVFSVSVGMTNRLAYAWIDGTDRGHGVSRFYGDTAPVRVLDGVRELMHDRTAAVRVA